MKEINIKELFRLLRELTESEKQRSVFVKTDCIVTTEAIKAFAGKNEKIRIRRDDISGKIEPQHRVLLDANYGFSGSAGYKTLLEDLKLYENGNVSKVFVVECDYAGPVPAGMEAYACKDDDAMKVGDVIDALETIDDKQTLVTCGQQGNGKTYFLTPDLNSVPTVNSVALQADTAASYPVCAILDTLKTCDRKAVFMVVGDIDGVVYGIERHADDGKKCGTVHFNCMSRVDVVEFNDKG